MIRLKKSLVSSVSRIKKRLLIRERTLRKPLNSSTLNISNQPEGLKLFFNVNPTFGRANTKFIMRKFIHQYKGAFLVLALLSMLVFTGCRNNSGNGSAMRTSKGTAVESVLPQNSGMVIALGTDNKNQSENMDKLKAYFPKDGLDKIRQSLIENMTKNGLDYENDIKPVFGEKIRMMVEMSNYPAKSLNAVMGAPAFSDTLLVVPIADETKADALQQKMIKNSNFLQDKHRDVIYFQKPGDKNLIAKVQDLLVVANSVQGLKDAIDRKLDAKPSLLDNDQYKKTLTELPDSIAFMFIQAKNYSPALYGVTQAQTSNYADEQNYLQAMDYQFFALSAEDKGLRISGKEYGDEKLLKNSKLNLKTVAVDKPVLANKVPAAQAMIYSEIANAKGILNLEMMMFERVLGVADLKSKIVAFFAASGLDFEKDVAAFFDKEMSLVMNDNGSLLPSLALYINASSNPVGAQKTLDVLDKLIRQGVDMFSENQKNLASALVFAESNLKDGAKVHVLRVKMQDLKSIINMPIELWYGLSKDNIAFIALYPNFDKDFGDTAKVVINDSTFKEVKSVYAKDLNGFTYISPAVFAQYVDKILAFASMTGDAENSANLRQQISAYTKPIKGILINSKANSESESEKSGFVLIAK